MRIKPITGRELALQLDQYSPIQYWTQSWITRLLEPKRFIYVVRIDHSSPILGGRSAVIAHENAETARLELAICILDKKHKHESPHLYWADCGMCLALYDQVASALSTADYDEIGVGAKNFSSIIWL